MNPFQRWLLWGSTLVTGATGLVYGWMKYFMEPAEPWAVVSHPLEPWMVKAHILVAPIMIFALGLVAADHIWKHFRNGVERGRPSGTLAMMLLVPMVLTGYLIQAVTHTGWLKALALAHIGTGVVYLAGYLVHGRVRRRNGENGSNGSNGGSNGSNGGRSHDGL